jgi:probable HAF family extracellular repeat protein
VVVGQSEDDTGRSQAFRWTEATGTVGLGSLPGFEESSLADGKVVAGQLIHRATVASLQAFRWSEASGMVLLGPLPGDNSSSVHAVSADGSIVAGTSQTRDANGRSKAAPSRGTTREWCTPSAPTWKPPESTSAVTG